MNGWTEYKKEPCPICQHKGWCGHSDDGVVVHCMRVPSANVCASGGWFHFLVDRPKRQPVPRAPKRPVRRLFDAAATMASFRAEFDRHRDGDVFDSLLTISKDLNLRAADVDRLRVGRSAHYQSWAFPMLDENAVVVGIRLRRYGSGDKFSVSGSRDGLFYDPDLQPLESTANGLKGRELVIVEGATDCIAGYAIGLPCVGRSSCATGGEMLRGLCARLRASRVTIVADYDSHKMRPDGTPWRPGIEGAAKLAQQLGRCYRIVTPPKKDLREWYYAGLDAETFWMVAGLRKWEVAT